MCRIHIGLSSTGGLRPGRRQPERKSMARPRRRQRDARGDEAATEPDHHGLIATSGRSALGGPSTHPRYYPSV